MPTQNHDLSAIADVIQEAITNLTDAAELLTQKQSGRHAERMVTTTLFEVAQLAGALPILRDLLRGPKSGQLAADSEPGTWPVGSPSSAGRP